MAQRKDSVFRMHARQWPRQWRQECQPVKLEGLCESGMLGIINLTATGSFPSAPDNLLDYFRKTGADVEIASRNQELTDEPYVHSPRQIEAVEDDAN